ncbi:MAG: flagellar hook-length control protein FliK [Spirochaetia bacterium]
MDSFLVTMTPSTAEKQPPHAQREASAAGIETGLSPFEVQLSREMEKTSRERESAGNRPETETSAEKPEETPAEASDEKTGRPAEPETDAKSADNPEKQSEKEGVESGEEAPVLFRVGIRKNQPVQAEKDKAASDKSKQVPVKPVPAKIAHVKKQEPDKPPGEAEAYIHEKPESKKKSFTGDKENQKTGKVIKDAEVKADQTRSGSIDEKSVKEPVKGRISEKTDIAPSPEKAESGDGAEKSVMNRVRPEQQEIKAGEGPREGVIFTRKAEGPDRGFSLNVTDWRTPADKGGAKQSKHVTKTSTVESQGPDISASKSDVSAKGSFQLRQEAEPPASQFQRVFRNVQEQMQGDFVRSARLVLKNAGNGEIRLLLRPEELGSVRIKMEVGDNRITGRIIVDSPQARETMEQNLPSLYKALKESGFESASLDISLGNREDGGEAGNRSKRNSETGNIRQAAGEFELNTVFADISTQDNMLVNLMV